MVAGREGEELSWKLDGMAEVKVSIWALPPPLISFLSPGSVSPYTPPQAAKAIFTLSRNGTDRLILSVIVVHPPTGRRTQRRVQGAIRRVQLIAIV